MIRKTKGYIVFLCPRCGSVRYSKGEQKTARCFGCGYQMTLDPLKIQILFKTDKREAAMEAVKRYKIRVTERSKRKLP